METNIERFARVLEAEYAVRFRTDPDYAYSAATIAPRDLALRMTAGLAKGSASKDGKAIRHACKLLGVPYTYRGIETFLAS